MDTIGNLYKNLPDINWKRDNQNYETTTKNLIKEKKNEISKVLTLKDYEMNYDNVVERLALVERELESEKNKIKFVHSIFPDQLLIDTYHDIENFLIYTDMRKDLYGALKKIRLKKRLLPEECDQCLNRMIFEKKIKGIELPKEQQEQLHHLKIEITKLCLDFIENVNKDSLCVKLDRVELEGLTDEFVSNLKIVNNQYIVDQNLRHILHILKYCRVVPTRKKIQKSYNTRGGDSNYLTLNHISKLRYQRARMQGYQNHVDFINKSLILKNGNNIITFLSNLASKLENSLHKERETVLNFKRQECQKMGILFDETIHIYDVSYYQRIVEEKEYSIDQNFIKQYFPIDHVTKMILKIYQSLLHLRFNKITETKNWKEMITIYSVRDEHSDQLLGYFYLNLFERQVKNNEFCHFPIKSTYTTNKGFRLSYEVMVANFTPPKGKWPSLLTHADIKSFFRNFCFVMHKIICKTRYFKFNATSIGLDFKHASMYMFEKFAWEEDVIRKLSSHYITKEKMSDDLITKLSLSRKANASMKFSFEIAVSIFDYKLHTTPDADAFDVYVECLNKYTSYRPTPGTSAPAAFSHMCNGLDANYYKYLLSEVIACDMFVSRFQKEGTSNRETGMSFRKNIIEPGSTKVSSEELLNNFLGRKYTLKPFLEYYGLT